MVYAISHASIACVFMANLWAKRCFLPSFLLSTSFFSYSTFIRYITFTNVQYPSKLSA